ncbi:hypothetical protein GCM10008915_41040 [Bifidobacterium pullorum subsp. gallinarum]
MNAEGIFFTEKSNIAYLCAGYCMRVTFCIQWNGKCYVRFRTSDPREEFIWPATR